MDKKKIISSIRCVQVEPPKMCNICAVNEKINLRANFSDIVLKDERFVGYLFDIVRLGMKIEEDAKTNQKK